VIGLLHHSSKLSTSYQRKIVLYDKVDFDSYRQLTDVDWETMFGHDDVDTIVDIIANTIVNTADNTIPNRLITVRKDSNRGLLQVSRNSYAGKIESIKKQNMQIL
jgi:hypothetical protein